MATFGERLKLLRHNKGVTQKQVAEMLNITDRGYRDYEIGNSTPNFDRLIFLADYFEVSLDYIVGRSDDPKRY